MAKITKMNITNDNVHLSTFAYIYQQIIITFYYSLNDRNYMCLIDIILNMFYNKNYNNTTAVSLGLWAYSRTFVPYDNNNKQ